MVNHHEKPSFGIICLEVFPSILCKFKRMEPVLILTFFQSNLNVAAVVFFWLVGRCELCSGKRLKS